MYKLFVMKKDSPLVIGIGENENYVASDISAYSDDTSAYIILEDMEMAISDSNDIWRYKNKKAAKILKRSKNENFYGKSWLKVN